MKKIRLIAILLVTAFVFVSCTASPQVKESEGDNKVPEIIFETLTESDKASFKGLDWLSSIEDTTKYFGILQNQKNNINIPKMFNDDYYSFSVNTYFPEFDIYGTAKFTFLIANTPGENAVTDILKDKRSGLQNMSFEFYFKSKEDVENFEDKYIEVFEKIATNNEFFTSFSYAKDSGMNSIKGVPYMINDKNFVDDYYLSIVDYSDSHYGEDEEVLEEEKYGALLADIYQTNFVVKMEFSFMLSR